MGEASRMALMDAPADAPTRIEYVRGPGAESCPDEGALRAAVIEKLGRDPFTDARSGRSLVAKVTRDGQTFRATIRLVDADGKTLGTRGLAHDGPRCDDLVASMALSMSVAIDPHADDAPRVEPSEPVPTPAKAQPERREVPPRTSMEPPDPIHIEAAAAPAVWVGAAPSASVGGSAFAAVRFRSVSLGLGGRTDLPASRRVSGAFVETSLAVGMLVPCAHVSIVELCGVLAMGSLRATSRDVPSPKEASGFHALAGARIGLALPVTSVFAVWAHADVMAALTRQTLGLDGTEVYTLPRISSGLGIGFRVRFF
jgi:hypothetical protein